MTTAEKEKIEKKKLLRILLDKKALNMGPYDISLNGGPFFAFVSPDEEVEDGFRCRRQISKFVTCREQLCEVPRAHLHEHEENSYIPVKTYKLDMSKTRLLVAGTSLCKERIFAAKKAINLLEEKVNWERTIISTVKHNSFKEKDTTVKFWLFTCPEQWIRVPQMLSLLCLIIRVFNNQAPNDITINNLKDVTTFFETIATKQLGRSNDNEYMGTVRKHIIPLMSNLDTIFTEGKYRYYVPHKSELKGWVGYGGIDTFCKMATGIDDLTTKFKRLINKEIKND